MTLTLDAVQALAPDDASAKAARGLLNPSKWPTLGAHGHAVWGECQGSGSKPYQTQVDLGGGAPAFRCSCPSRKFPCKHGLALLMLQAQDASRFKDAEPPAWVSEWHASRNEKAQKKQEQQERQREQAATIAADPAALAAAAAQTAKQEAKRWARIDAGVAELQRWLGDRLRQGLGTLTPRSATEWDTLAARLVDAQAPGLAARVRDAADTLRRKDTAADADPDELLQQLGLLQLAVDAVQRRAELNAPQDAATLADLRTLVGWPQDRAELLARAELLHDRWLVLGQITEEREGRLRERRVWLLGLQSGRRALLLDHAHGTTGFELAWLNGAVVPAQLAWYPGAAAQRALVAQIDLPPAAGHAAAEAQTTEPPWPLHPHAAEWQWLAERVAACPWTPLHPLLWRNARVLRDADRFWLQLDPDDAAADKTPPRRLPLLIGDDDGWTLLAFGGSHPLHLMGEWDGRALRPLSARHAADGADHRWNRSA